MSKIFSAYEFLKCQWTHLELCLINDRSVQIYQEQKYRQQISREGSDPVFTWSSV